MSDAQETGVLTDVDEGAPPRRGRGCLRRLAVGSMVTFILLALAGVVLYSFGSMERPSAEVRAEFDGLVAAGVAVPLQGRFTIPIPGCRCHSDDPVLQLEHSRIRIRECKGCHGSVGPQ